MDIAYRNNIYKCMHKEPEKEEQEIYGHGFCGCVHASALPTRILVGGLCPWEEHVTWAAAASPPVTTSL